MSGWSSMTPEEFRTTGLLWAVNTFVLWPIGAALAIQSEDGLTVLSLTESETIEEGKIDIEQEPGGCHPRERFLHYAETRVLEMPTEMEQATATRRVRALVPGFGISPLKTDATT